MLRVLRRPSSHESVALSGADSLPETKGNTRPSKEITPAEPWQELGFPDLGNTIRRICTLCGWSQSPIGRGKTLAVGSAIHGEGKSSVARALAIAMARDHACDVLLMECDLLQPSLHHDFGGGEGLSEVLSGARTFDDVLRPTRLPNLWLLLAGTLSDNPSRLLRSPAMTSLLTEVQSRFGFTVMDIPPTLKSSDATVLARQADGAVLVVRAGSTDQRSVTKAIDLLSGATLHGVVLNRHRSSVPDIVRRLLVR